MSIHEKALDSIFGDMDDLESKKMFGDKDNKGMSITITVSPNGDVGMEEPDGDESEMNKGGYAMHTGGTVPKPEGEADIFSGYDKGDPEYKKGEVGMSDGGKVPELGETDDISLPPFLRKKKK